MFCSSVLFHIDMQLPSLELSVFLIMLCVYSNGYLFSVFIYFVCTIHILCGQSFIGRELIFFVFFNVSIVSFYAIMH